MIVACNSPCLPAMKPLATPIVWVVVLLTLGLILSGCKRRKDCSGAGWWFVLVGTRALLAFSLRPIANDWPTPLKAGSASSPGWPRQRPRFCRWRMGQTSSKLALAAATDDFHEELMCSRYQSDNSRRRAIVCHAILLQDPNVPAG